MDHRKNLSAAASFSLSSSQQHPMSTMNSSGMPLNHGKEKPFIVLMGLRRGGKSSISKVVFQKMSPNDTLFLESTSKVSREDIRTFVDIRVEDFPGHWDLSEELDPVLKKCGALVFVIDVQDDYLEALQRLYLTVTRAYKLNPQIHFEVFIHKVDGLSDDYKIETQRDIHQRLTDELTEAGLDAIHLSFYLTSIYDHSIFEAFSKVIQKLIPQLPTLESLLNILCSNSGIEKAFLFDIISKIYIATDSSPVDMQSYELCSDMIDVVLDLSSIYGTGDSKPGSPVHTKENSNSNSAETYSVIKLSNGILYMRPVSASLALVCLIREDSYAKSGLIDYNFRCLCDSILEVFQ